MLKPKKRKNRVQFMRGKDGGYIIRTDKTRVVLTQDAMNGILLVHDPDFRYPNASRVVRLAVEFAHRNKQRYPMKKEFFWSDFRPSDKKFHIPTDGVMGRELNWSEHAAGWMKPKVSDSAKAVIAGMEIKGVQLRQSKIASADIESLVAEFGNIAEQQLIERFVKDPTPSAEAVENAQRIGGLMVHRWLEKQGC